MLRRAPAEYESAYCFYRVTLEQRAWAEAEQVFDELIARHPQNAWLVLAYGHVHRTRDPDRAEDLYRRAATAFEGAGDLAGEVEARANLANFLRPKGRVAEARDQVERVATLATSASDPLVKAQAWILQAGHLQATGGDLGVSYRMLKQAEEILPDNPPYIRERALLIALGAAAFRLGRLEEALATYRRLERLALEKGEALVLANARYNILNASEAIEAVLPTPGARERLIELAQRSLATAVTAANLDITLKSHRALADLLAPDAGARTTSIGHARECLALAVDARQPADEAACSWILASLLTSDQPRAAVAAAQRAIDATNRDNNPRTQAHSAGRQMRLRWRTGARREAVRDSLTALAAVEALRALQDDTRSRADLFSAWTSDYYWLSGRLLQEERPDVSLAFSVVERMRARALLDAVDRSRQPLDATHTTVVAHRRVLHAIAALQRTLMHPALAEEQRKARLRELERLERNELDARRAIALAFPDRRDVPRPSVSLEAVQAALGADQALLSFQVGLWQTYAGDEAGGSWLIAVTRQRRTIHRLPDRSRLMPAVPMFTGLLEGGDPGASAAVRLYEALVSGALSTLPSGITRLVVVPDGPLHHLPFEALQAARDEPPLGARYEIVIAPSATLWHQWRTSKGRRNAGRTLVVAEPLPSAGTGDPAESRGDALLRGVPLGRLPHARAESRAIARHVQGVDVLVAAHASERAVKRGDSRRYGILHFAAHAVADESHPERSAVLLAPGALAEDGLLQAREIAALDLDGSIVVLSACRTATGATLSGEGVLSLARAFFEAGAHAVVGTRWPLRDADAAMLFEVFYRHLAGGASLSSALRSTQAEARAAGLSPRAWAGLVLLGNGDLRPFAGRRPSQAAKAGASAWPAPTRHGRHLAPIAAALALTLLVGVGVVLARR